MKNLNNLNQLLSRIKSTFSHKAPGNRHCPDWNTSLDRHLGRKRPPAQSGIQ